MIKRFLILIAALYQVPAYADILAPFRDEEGRTNWQYVANFSSSMLILLLIIAVTFLFFAHRRARQSNRALEDIRKSLEQRVVERTVNLEKANQLLTGEIEQHRETTARLQSSEAYIKSILDSMPLMLIGLNKDMEITQWNHMAESTTGMSQDMVLGQNLWEAYPTITLSADQAKEVLHSQKTVTIQHSQRGQYYFDITLYPLQDQTDTGLVVLVDDITQQMKAENKLVQRDKMSAMGELAAAMAHDIDSPVASILETLRDVQSQMDESSGVESVGDLRANLNPRLVQAKRSGRQASAIITNLLEFSRRHGDKKQNADMTAIMDRSVEVASSLLSHPSGFNFSDIPIERHYEPSLPLFPCYAAELQQVYMSLLRHAFHALCDCLPQPDFKPFIRIEIAEFYDALWIKVQHNGRGLNSEEQTDIFEPFFSNTSDQPSCPVEHRLSFSYFIVTEHHNGHLAVTSDLSVGTTFHVQLQRN